MSPAGKGYLAVTTYPSGTNYKILQEIKANIVDKGKSDLRSPDHFGTVYYNSGLQSSAKFTNKDAQPRWPSRALSHPHGRLGLSMLCHATDNLPLP
jgi:branched-chain amino acid transport system substrate-binding protein